MSYSLLKRTGIFAAAALFSFSVFAEDPAAAHPKEAADFLTICTNAWMEKSDAAKDKVDFKNFGEKYCACAASQPLGNDEAIQKAIHVCMSRTLLHDALDAMEDDVGLSKAQETDFIQFCQDRWNLIYPNLSAEDKKVTMAYCECAKPKVMTLIKQADNLTDKQYDDGVNDIAAACSEDALAEKPKTSTSTPAAAPAEAPAPATTTAPTAPATN
ncbi:hypothetical protein [Legionella saoudiensis]|uniref:hypothetical protein n=1 Tax=Legionella saoudiensis TaxID=1750561 RepID=UPI0007308557|nr:hypothetical protein [Legionella saoudiensis]